MLTGRNAADSATKWAINNDGSAQFSTLAAWPAGSSFGTTVQAYLGDAVNAAAEHTSGTKPFVAGVEGNAYLETAGTVTTLAGVAGYASMSGTSGTVSKLASLYAYTNDKSAGTVTDNYGLYVDAQTAGSSNYSIFTAGTAPAQFGGAVISGMNTVTFSATPTFDARLGNTQKITLTDNVTSSTLSNASAGEQIHFLICQDSTGSRTFAWPSNVKGGMTIGSTGSMCNAQSFIFGRDECLRALRGSYKPVIPLTAQLEPAPGPQRSGPCAILTAGEAPMAENPETSIESLLQSLPVVPEVSWYHLADPASPALDQLAVHFRHPSAAGRRLPPPPADGAR